MVIQLNEAQAKITQNPYLELLVRWFLGITFIFACYHKIVDPAQFAKIIYGYKLFPAFSINLIAIILPFIELICGLGLILGIYPRSAILIVNGLLLVFIVTLSINLARGHEFNCGCFAFGDNNSTSSTIQLLMRDIIFLGCGLFVLLFKVPRKWCFRNSGSLFQNEI